MLSKLMEFGVERIVLVSLSLGFVVWLTCSNELVKGEGQTGALVEAQPRLSFRHSWRCLD